MQVLNLYVISFLRNYTKFYDIYYLKFQLSNKAHYLPFPNYLKRYAFKCKFLQTWFLIKYFFSFFGVHNSEKLFSCDLSMRSFLLLPMQSLSRGQINQKPAILKKMSKNIIFFVENKNIFLLFCL